MNIEKEYVNINRQHFKNLVWGSVCKGLTDRKEIIYYIYKNTINNSKNFEDSKPLEGLDREMFSSLHLQVCYSAIMCLLSFYICKCNILFYFHTNILGKYFC
jgi:hypothetical protein